MNKVPKASLPSPDLKLELLNCRAHALSTLPLSPVKLVAHKKTKKADKNLSRSGCEIVFVILEPRTSEFQFRVLSIPSH